MAESTSLFIPASTALGNFAVSAVNIISTKIPALGLEYVITPLFLPVYLALARIIGGLFGTLGQSYIFVPLLQLLPTLALKGIYVGGQVGFFVAFNLLGKIPLLLPVAILLGAVTSVVGIIVAGLLGFLADLFNFFKPLQIS